jgi:hypothetical protein
MDEGNDWDEELQLNLKVLLCKIIEEIIEKGLEVRKDGQRTRWWTWKNK